MLVARLVGASGEVVGIERDADSIERAEARVAAADLRNVNFLNTDVNKIVADDPFDAAVGRFILMFLPDPISVLRSVAGLVRPGGVLAFQEPSWTVMLALGARLPLWSRTRHLIHEITECRATVGESTEFSSAESCRTRTKANHGQENSRADRFFSRIEEISVLCASLCGRTKF